MTFENGGVRQVPDLVWSTLEATLRVNRKACVSAFYTRIDEVWREAALAAGLQAVRQNGATWGVHRQTLKYVTLPEHEGLWCEVWGRVGTASTTRDLRDV